MDFQQYYDCYWSEKDEGIDPNRVRQVLGYLKPNQLVLDLGCGHGKMAAEINRSQAKTIGLDFSAVILRKAFAREITVVRADMDEGHLPFQSDCFDAVVFAQTIEHVFHHEHVMSEAVRVLKDGGQLILSFPNIAHWRFRLALLFGRFPYIEDTQTHSQHIRFFTLSSIRKLCQKHDLTVKASEGNSALGWCPIYYWRMNMTPVRQCYELATKVYPALFAFHITVIGEKKGNSWKA